MPTFTDPAVAMMVGAGEQVRVTKDRRIVPLERFGVRYVSMALFVGDEDRGDLARAYRDQARERIPVSTVEWVELDSWYSIFRLEPATPSSRSPNALRSMAA